MAETNLQRYTHRAGGTPGENDRDTDNVDNLGGWGLLRGHRDRGLSLELRKKDDSVLAIPYALIEQFVYTPGDGITLRIAGREIRIRGGGLNETSSQQSLTLFTALNRHRVLWIAEKSHADRQNGNGSCTIESISW